MKKNNESVSVFHEPDEWEKELRLKNELLGEVLNELILRKFLPLNDTDTLECMCEAIADVRYTLSILMSDLKNMAP